MSTALVFGPLNSLDFFDVRSQVLRIPEVSLRIREAQSAWDKISGGNFSFHHFLNTHDHSFFNNVNLKTLALAIVQLGLYDRYTRLFGEPEFMVGNIQNEAPVLVASGQLDLQGLIENSRARNLTRPLAPLKLAEDTLLSGQSLPTFQIYTKRVGEISPDQSKFKTIGESNLDLNQLLAYVIEKMHAKKVVHVGPGLIEKSKCFQQFALHDVQIVESIDADPMLQWFWSDLRKYDLEARAAQ